MSIQEEAQTFTAYHAAYYAHVLTQRNASDNVAKLGPSLINARVDLNPHLLDATMFAFRSPLSRGAILADEVGLGTGAWRQALVVSSHSRRSDPSEQHASGSRGPIHPARVNHRPID